MPEQLTINTEEKRTRKRTPARGARRPWHVLLLGLGALSTAGIAGVLYGWPATAAIIGFVTALIGLGKALIELSLVLDKHDAELVAPARNRRRAVVPIVSASLLMGMVIGYAGLPWLVDLALQPAADITVPERVVAVQPVRLTWRNVSPTDDLRVFVRAIGRTTDVVDPCRTSGSRRGRITCEIGIGGSDDTHRQFELRVVRLPHEISEQFAPSLEGSYVTGVPDGGQVLATAVVTRTTR